MYVRRPAGPNRTTSYFSSLPPSIPGAADRHSPAIKCILEKINNEPAGGVDPLGALGESRSDTRSLFARSSIFCNSAGRAPNAIRSIETPRVHIAARRRSGVAVRGARLAVALRYRRPPCGCRMVRSHAAAGPAITGNGLPPCCRRLGHFCALSCQSS
jgi:hypothetical protein